jgi:hypothetical protein
MNKNDVLMVEKSFLYNLILSLEEMIDYADDGIIPEDDDDFSDFFESVRTARENLKKLNELLVKGE